jgi:hypothetical protein
VALSPIPLAGDEDEPLIVSSISDDLDLVVDMVISLVGILEPDLLTPIGALDMCSFQSMFLPSSEEVLEAMTKFCPFTWFPSVTSYSWKL